MNGGKLIGQTLDGKYKIESEIGKGGMGTVYLATHVGTGRPVALKVIASEFMQRLEFVERFRREARAAGRLRHPNVVNVTDFGFANTKTGEAAYLVMEYLDGCTLGEILEEEKKLPLSWTLDILEQVCSAVQEAHDQGIIHRDLKPDNIWLEPNQRGGYTVKVLDFGIAKLEEHIADEALAEQIEISIAPNANLAARATIADHAQPNTIAENRSATMVSEAATMAQFAQNDLEAGTLIQTNDEVDLESGTAIFNGNEPTSENEGTKLISKQIETDGILRRTGSTAELTRVGAVLGTPLYMSPEQCRGERLSTQSDIYSLGVIAYQMLAGKTPFGGDYLEVMEAHKASAPPILDAGKVPKKVKSVINSAMAKSIADRPPTAQAFASELRAQSEGIGTLLRRALEIYSKHLPKFLGLAVLLYSPLALVTFLKVAMDIFYLGEQISDTAVTVMSVLLTLATTFVGIFCGYLVFGTTTWIVAQTLAVPLRPIQLRPALRATRRKWKSLVGTGLLTTILSFIGYILCIPGLIMSVLWALVAPVVMMENLRGRAAMKRSSALVKRSLGTTTAAVFIMFMVPFLVASLTSGIVAMSVKAFSGEDARIKDIKEEVLKAEKEGKPLVEIQQANGEKQIVFGKERLSVGAETDEENFGKRLREVIREDANTILMLPFQILIGSLWSIIAALLYLKTRQTGGESMQDLLSQFAEADQPRTSWQKRVQARLEQTSGKPTSKT